MQVCIGATTQAFVAKFEVRPLGLHVGPIQLLECTILGAQAQSGGHIPEWPNAFSLIFRLEAIAARMEAIGLDD